MEELFDVCDEHDRVLRQAPRSQVHANKWLHRAVHVFVFNPRGELLLQLRSKHKDEYPLMYTSSASGHLSAGEDYDTCAPRELGEELGLSAPLERLHKFAAGPETSYEHTVLYRTTAEEPPRIDPAEVFEVSWHAPAEVQAMIARDPERFTPCFCTLFDWYVTHHTAR